MSTPSELGGYEYEFVDTPPDRLVCKICFHPCRDPYLTGCCGHNFCKLCMDTVKNTTNTCPFCRSNELNTFSNRQADREVRSLHVMCTNKERGCEWHGELNNINNHLGNSDGCQFEDVKCSNECGKMLQRQYLTGHVETECPRCKVDCQYCHVTGEHQFIEGEHKEQCPKLLLPCPNKCEVGGVPREDMEAHRKECPLEMLQCEYHNVGCEERMMRKDLEKHEHDKMKEHLSFTKSRLTTTDQQLKLTSSQLADARSHLDEALDQINTLTILMYQTSMAQKQTIGPSSPLPTISTAQWWARLTAKAMIIKSGDQECPVIMSISVTELAQKSKEMGYWFSDQFYTCNKGYMMCLRVNVAGSGKSSHLSVFQYLMKGPHDDELTWPLRGKFELKLLNQISDCQHTLVTLIYGDNDGDNVTGRVTGRDKAAAGAGYSQFISTKDLYKVTPTRQYVKDDSIFLQVSKL